MLLAAQVLAVAGLVAGPVKAGETCGCDVPPVRVAAYDDALIQVLSQAGATPAQQHAPYGLPRASGPQSTVVELAQRHWVTGYDVRRRLPLWVAYRLTAGDLAHKRRRTQCFRPDPRLAADAGGTRCASYRRDGFDRGHMVPSADMTRSEQAMVNTYVFSNIAHQYPGFNRTLWRDLEIRVRAIARLRGQVYVLTGAAFDGDGDGRADAPDRARYPRSGVPGGGRPKAALATHFYKVVFVPDGGTGAPGVTAWLLKHEDIRTRRAQSKRLLDARRVPLAVIEEISGFDIAPALNGIVTADAAHK